eukprot:GHUV01011555.1.p1 GENE.GHUV01011555.1~~GHUV01011555.1.p1  ORF type:complete len:370 (+),score=118.24 GHUV01011555.1:64-1173(+)
MAALRERVYNILEQKDAELEALRQQLRNLGPAGAAAAASAAATGSGASALGRFGTAVGAVVPVQQSVGASGGGLPVGRNQAGWGSAYSSACPSPSPSHSAGALSGTVSGAWNAAASGGDRSAAGGLASPAFSGKFTGMLLSGSGGTAGHSRSASLSHQQLLGPSPLSYAGSGGAYSAARRTSSTGASLLSEPPAAVVAVEPSRSRTEAAELPLSTLRLSIDGAGNSGGGAALEAGSATSPLHQGLAPDALKHRLQELDSQAREWKTAWEEADRRTRVLNEEVARLESMSQITDRDALYLRSVIVSGFESGELPGGGAMFGVLSRLLHFSPQEMSRIKQHAQTSKGSGISSLVLGAMSGGPAVGGGGVRR